MVKLYHYTNEEGLRGIKKDGVIRSSTSSKDSCYGRGVYLTSLNPEQHSKDHIAKNNWNDAGSTKKSQGCLDYYIEITFDDNDRSLRPDGFKDNRNIYRYKGDLVLANYEWSCGKNTEWSATEIAVAVGLGALAVGGLAFLGKCIYESWYGEPTKSTNDPNRVQSRKTPLESSEEPAKRTKTPSENDEWR